jgi:hypothetical protein
MPEFTEKGDYLKAWENAPLVVYGWTQDFVKALAERPKFIRLILRFVFGKYAYREFIGIVDTLIAAGDYFNYELDNMDYHKEKVRSDFVQGSRHY